MAKKRKDVRLSEMDELAEEQLRYLRELRTEEVRMVEEVNDLIKEAAERYREALAKCREQIKQAEAGLQQLMKGCSHIFFAAGDIHALASGSLLRQEEEKVTIHGKKDEVVARLEAAGWLEAVKVEKTFDRDLISGWPEERLAAINAERKKVETFNYDLKK